MDASTPKGPLFCDYAVHVHLNAHAKIHLDISPAALGMLYLHVPYLTKQLGYGAKY